MIRYMRRIKRRLLIVWHWLPIIWGDYDFDHWYIERVLLHKIRRTRISLEANKRHSRWQDDVRDMKLAESLLERILAGDFSVTGRHDEAKGPMNFCTCESERFKNTWEDVGGGVCRWRNPFCSWCCNKLVSKLESQRENMHYELLFNILRRKIRRWWD